MKKEELEKCLKNYQENVKDLKQYLNTEMGKAKSELKDAHNAQEKLKDIQNAQKKEKLKDNELRIWQSNARYRNFKEIHDWIKERNKKFHADVEIRRSLIFVIENLSLL